MSEVFVRSKKKFEPGFNVATMLSRKATAGDVGLEIEVEGNKFPCPDGMKGSHQPVVLPDLPRWSYVHDGSLRGADNAEYVLTKPVLFDEVRPAVEELWAKLTAYGSVIAESNRTSVHVHLNCQNFHLNRLTAFMALYFTMEEVLTEWCGDHRVGNLFCLRGKDAPAIVSQVKKFIKTDGRQELRDHLHYAGLNANALHKFGSLEVRSLRGCTEPETIIDWVSILQRLYDLSAEFSDPRDICALFSREGPLAFFDNILGDKANLVRDGISFDATRIGESMYEGIRLAQDLCYCRDWGVFQQVDMKPDPFGRKSGTMMKKIAAAGGFNLEAALQAVEDPIIEYDPDDDPEEFDGPVTMAVPTPPTAPTGGYLQYLGGNPFTTPFPSAPQGNDHQWTTQQLDELLMTTYNEGGN